MSYNPPLTCLPKSKSTPASTSLATNAYAAHANTNRNWQTLEDPDFTHPDHVIPPPNFSMVENLIIVCCHAIFLPDAEHPDFPLYSPHDESNWLLASFQKSNPDTGKPGEHETFLAHVKAGLDALTLRIDQEHPPSSLLVLSGGATKRPQTYMSEARSYYHAALADELTQGHLHGGRAHHMFRKGYVRLEERSTDSFQNLLFSILLFKKTTGRYPKHIRIITHAFKSKRFLELHAPAIGWPADRIQVQGIDPAMSCDDLTSALAGEEQFGYALWKVDPLGLGNVLSTKRKQRGWADSCLAELQEDVDESVRGLLQGRAPTQLPWSMDKFDARNPSTVG